MGCCTSKPGSADGGSGGSGTASKRTPAATQSSLLAQRRQSAQDPGLSETHEYVKPLGRGGTGEICHFRDQKTGENVSSYCAEHVQEPFDETEDGAVAARDSADIAVLTCCLLRVLDWCLQVAIKLIKRPVPRVVATSLLREILVSYNYKSSPCVPAAQRGLQIHIRSRLNCPCCLFMNSPVSLPHGPFGRP